MPRGDKSAYTGKQKRQAPLSQPWLPHIASNSTGVDVLAIGRLLLPEFMDYEGSVFLGIQFTKDSFARWMSVLRNMKGVESMINHVHVYDIIDHDNKMLGHDVRLSAHLL